MKLAIVQHTEKYLEKGEDISLDNDKYIICDYEYYRETAKGHSVYSMYVLCVLVNVTKDFDPYSESIIKVDSDTSSFQIRPKLIYKDRKGLYYKPYGKVVRLNEGDVSRVKEYLQKFGITEYSF